MKKQLIIVTIIIGIIFLSGSISWAAFPITSINTSAKVSNVTVKDQSIQISSTDLINNIFPINIDAPEQAQASGGMGIASFVCSLVGLLVLPIVLGVLAVVFGVLGMRPGKPHHGLAVAGFIIGIVDIIAGIIIASA